MTKIDNACALVYNNVTTIVKNIKPNTSSQTLVCEPG